MQNLIRGVIGVGVAVLFAMGMAESLWKNQRDSEFFVKSAQTYWNDTHLTEVELLDLLQDESCQSSEKYFLACVNAIQAVAQKYQLSLQFSGHLAFKDSLETGSISEKATLQPWQDFFQKDPEKVAQISFLEIWDRLKSKKIKQQELSQSIGIGLNAFLSVLRDPHTYLIPTDYYNEVVAQLNPKTTSLGVIVARGLEQYFVRKVLAASPADYAGLKKGDLLLKVNNKNIQNLSLQRVGELMKAEGGELTRLLIQRGISKKTVAVKRSTQPVPTVSWKYEKAKKYAVLTINKFARGTCDKTQETLLEILQNDVKGLLLDLRDNSGGQMEEASCIASLFLGKNRKILTLQYRDASREPEVMYGQQDQVYFGALGVLINSGTASAAEILAGVLQEYHRGVLVGERTFGKGTFQEGEVWDGNPQIALFETKGYFTMPSGRSPQLVGILPDVPVVFKESKTLREEDLYINPFSSPLLTNSQGNKNKLKLDLCSAIQAERKDDSKPAVEFDFDPQLDKATEILNCPAVANNMTGF